jgi:hypothetical protein
MPRPQFTLKTLLWVVALVGAFFAGAGWQRQREKPVSHGYVLTPRGVAERMVMPDGKEWFRGSVSAEEAKGYFDAKVKIAPLRK